MSEEDMNGISNYESSYKARRASMRVLARHRRNRHRKCYLQVAMNRVITIVVVMEPYKRSIRDQGDKTFLLGLRRRRSIHGPTTLRFEAKELTNALTNQEPRISHLYLNFGRLLSSSVFGVVVVSEDIGSAKIPKLHQHLKGYNPTYIDRMNSATKRVEISLKHTERQP
jgi:hypothetical protein